jgi:very-short-patch-repair endonuclease
MSADTKKRSRSSKPLLPLAKAMRREPTQAEARFWHYAKNRGIGGLKFRRQVPVGPYVADFLCAERMLIVEIDGGQHADNAHDDVRDAYLAAEGYVVLRFWNSDVLADMVAVGETILKRLSG